MSDPQIISVRHRLQITDKAVTTIISSFTKCAEGFEDVTGKWYWEKIAGVLWWKRAVRGKHLV